MAWAPHLGARMHVFVSNPLFDDDDDRSFVNRVPYLKPNFLNDAIDRGFNGNFHLHRFEQQHFFIFFDRLSWCQDTFAKVSSNRSLT